MSFNKELFKNKILYRASYRGTKEMDKLMQGFVRSIIDKIDENDLKVLKLSPFQTVWISNKIN